MITFTYKLKGLWEDYTAYYYSNKYINELVGVWDGKNKESIVGYGITYAEAQRDTVSHASMIAKQVFDNKYIGDFFIKKGEIEFYILQAVCNTFADGENLSDELFNIINQFEYNDYLKKNQERIKDASFYILHKLNEKKENDAITYAIMLTYEIIQKLGGNVPSLPITQLAEKLVKSGDVVTYLDKVYKLATNKTLALSEIVSRICNSKKNENKLSEIIRDIKKRITEKNIPNFEIKKKMHQATIVYIIYRHCKYINTSLTFKDLKIYLGSYFGFEDNDYKESKIKDTYKELYSSNSIIWKIILGD